MSLHKAGVLSARALLGGAATVALVLLFKHSAPSTAPVAAQPSVSSVQGAIDLPIEGGTIHGASYVIGWAIDTSSGNGPGIHRVSVWLDGAYVGDAHLGFARDDIAAAYGKQFQAAGWQALVDLDAVSTPGQHRVEIRLHSSVSGTETTMARGLAIDGPQQFCVNDHPLRFDIQSAEQHLDETRAGGLSMMRIDVSWAALEPDAPGVWDTVYAAKLDDVLALARARGVRPILVVVSTPAWARGGSGSLMTPPTQPTAFGDFLGRLAAHNADRLGMIYEVWNEPNQTQFWDTPEGPNPARYASLLRAAYTSIKDATPYAIVLGGSIAFSDPGYLQGMYAAGAAGAFDGLALHPYSATNAPHAVEDPSRSLLGPIDQAHDILSSHGEANKPIWVTEMGWSQADLSDAARAAFFKRAVDLVRSRSNVAAFCAYTLDQQGDDAAFGLIGPGGATRSWLSYVQAVGAR